MQTEQNKQNTQEASAFKDDKNNISYNRMLYDLIFTQTTQKV